MCVGEGEGVCSFRIHHGSTGMRDDIKFTVSPTQITTPAQKPRNEDVQFLKMSFQSKMSPLGIPMRDNSRLKLCTYCPFPSPFLEIPQLVFMYVDTLNTIAQLCTKI